jgi:Signal transduction histidine kinase
MQFTNFQNITDVSIGNVAHISRAADNGFWITNHHGDIVHYSKLTKQFTALPVKNIQGLGTNWCSIDDGKGHLYVGHGQSGLSIVDLKNKTVQNFLNDPKNPYSLPGNTVNSICIDHFGNVWIGTDHGLALYHQNTGEFTTFKHIPGNINSLIAAPIYALREMKDGTLWIASDIGGISILNLNNIAFATPQNITFQNIIPTNNNNSLSSGNIRSLLQDSYGNIWIGNYSSGVDFISRTPLHFHILPYIDKGEIVKYKPVWGIYADSEQQVWLGGENEIALFKDNKQIKTYDISTSLSRAYSQVFNIKRDLQDNLWLGLLDEGILKFNPQNNHFERIQLFNVMTIFNDNDGKLLIGTANGLYRYTQGVIHKEDYINNQLGEKSNYGILRDRQGKLWIGSFGEGISVFNKNNKLITRLKKGNGFCSNIINQLYMDSKGAVWAATKNGLGYFKETMNPNSFEIFNNKHGLTDSYVRAIQEDKTGDIWVSTNNGISLWNKKNRKFENYDYRDGIPLGNFIDGSVCMTSNGTMYFGSLKGVCYFNPLELKSKQWVSQVQLIDCDVFKRQTENGDNNFIIPIRNQAIELPYNQNSFRISFAVPDYSQSQQVEYAYMMEGLENSWNITRDENQVTFRNISPGSYIFKVKARLKNQDWDEIHVASISIIVHPPIWLAWYAKLIYALIMLLIAYYLIVAYKRKLILENTLELERRNSLNEQELNKERLRFYTNITHELRTPLTLILGPLEDLISDNNLSSYYNNKISIIHNSALRLLNLINQILEFRKTETQNRKLTVCKDDIGNLVTEIGLRYKELNRNEKVAFNINIETKETGIYFDSEIIATILNNLLSNAVKYTSEGEISIILRSISEEDNLFTEIEVKDTGYGINEMDLPRIFDPYFQACGEHQASGTGIGLALVKSLSVLHDGFLYVDSLVGKGTSFRFRILTQNTYPDALHKDNNTSQSGKEIFSQEDEIEKDIVEKPTILIVEDNRDIRDYITSSLHKDYNVIVAENGKEGLNFAQKNIPNLIVSDIMMPVMDGIQLCHKIKEDMRTSHIPVILLTAKDTIQDKEEGYESGADSYITKPFSAKLLRVRIQNILESRKRLAQQIASQTPEINAEKLQYQTQLNKLDEEFLAKITKIVEENLDSEKLDISFMMVKMNMSHTAFYRKVKALTGVSANEFIRKIRLKNSLQLILSGSCNISEAAYKTGFNDLGYFRECFKEEFKISPSEYLKQVKNNSDNPPK